MVAHLSQQAFFSLGWWSEELKSFSPSIWITRNGRISLKLFYADIGPIVLVNLATNNLDNVLLVEKFCSREDPSTKARLVNAPGAINMEHILN